MKYVTVQKAARCHSVHGLAILRPMSYSRVTGPGVFLISYWLWRAGLEGPADAGFEPAQ